MCEHTDIHIYHTFSASGRSTPCRKTLPSAACLLRRHSAPAPVLTSPHHGNSVAKSCWGGKGDRRGRQRGTQQQQPPRWQFGNKPCITSGEANLTAPGLGWTSFFGGTHRTCYSEPGLQRKAGESSSSNPAANLGFLSGGLGQIQQTFIESLTYAGRSFRP